MKLINLSKNETSRNLYLFKPSCQTIINNELIDVFRPLTNVLAEINDEFVG